MLDIIVLDLETGGRDPLTHPILSIGAVRLHQPDDRFYVEMQRFKGSQLDPRALQINRFSYEEIQNFTKTEEQGIRELRNYIDKVQGPHIIAGQNVGQFDLQFLEAAKKRTGVELNLGHRVIDIHSIAIAKMLSARRNPLKAIGSQEIVDYCGLTRVQVEHHGLKDALLELEVLHRLLYGKSVLPEFLQFPVPEQLISDAANSNAYNPPSDFSNVSGFY